MDEKILSLVAELMKIREDYAKASAAKTELEEKKKKAEYALYYAMEENDIKSFKHEQFGTVYRSHRVWCKVVDEEKVYKFLKERGVFDEIMKLEPRTGRLNQLIKEEFLDKSGVIPESDIGIQVTLSPMIGNRQIKGGDIAKEEVPF